MSTKTWSRILIGWTCIALSLSVAQGQDRLKTMPGYTRYQQAMQALFASFRQSSVNVVWADGGKTVGYEQNGKNYRFDIAQGRAEEVAEPISSEERPRRGRQGGFRDRGRQFTSATSPDGKKIAFYRDRNLWLKNADGSDETRITTDGSVAARIKYATGSWVYGEELEQTTAFWWSPDSRKIAFYRFDESKVPDFYIAMHTLAIQDELDTEPYPKSGAPNPIVDLLSYDLNSRKTTRVDVRDGKPFDNSVVGHYVYDILWSPDGTQLLFNRTNRRQNVMEFCAADPDTGRCRVIVREEWPASWTENRPERRFLKDGNRFILASERSGFRNYYLYDLSGKLIAPLTSHTFDVERIVDVDETDDTLYYMARGGDNYLGSQFYRVQLDGNADKRLTDPSLHHTISLAPDFKHFVDTEQDYDKPPVTQLIDADGRLVAELSHGAASAQPLRAERFTYKAADGVTDLYGVLYKPSNFDPNRKYPLLVDVYGGPESEALGRSMIYGGSNPITEFGFLVAEFAGRGTVGRGKRFKDAMYGKLGITEIDDEAAGVKSLRKRPYIDGAHVGIYGTSYGGYASLMSILRYPDVFQAASCSSSVTDWRNYDSIYTERYMWLPQENETAYSAGTAANYAQNLHGKLLLYYGTADNNVHPNNTMQVVRALQSAGKSFEVQVGPDMGHSAVNNERMLEFFIDALTPAAR